jgi:hypothetical protein
MLGSSPAAKVGFVVTGAEETLQQSQRSASPRPAERGGAWKGNEGEDPYTGASGTLPRGHGPAASRPDETGASREPGDPAGLPEHLRHMPSAASKQNLPVRLKAAQLQHDIVVAGIRVGDNEGFTAPDIVAHLGDSGRDRRALARRVLAAINDRLIPHGLVVDTGNTRMTPRQLDLREKNPRAGGRPARVFQVTEQGRQAVGLVTQQHSRRVAQASGTNSSHSKNGAAGSQAPEQGYKVYRRREADDGEFGWEEVV